MQITSKCSLDKCHDRWTKLNCVKCSRNSAGCIRLTFCETNRLDWVKVSVSRRAATDIYWINYSLIKISPIVLSDRAFGRLYFNLFKFVFCWNAHPTDRLSFSPIHPRNHYYRNNYHKTIYCFVYCGPDEHKILVVWQRKKSSINKQTESFFLSLSSSSTFHKHLSRANCSAIAKDFCLVSRWNLLIIFFSVVISSFSFFTPSRFAQWFHLREQKKKLCRKKHSAAKPKKSERTRISDARGLLAASLYAAVDARLIFIYSWFCTNLPWIFSSFLLFLIIPFCVSWCE